MTLDVFHPLDTVENAREILGIVYCETCRMDTLILEPQGICGFCDQPLREGAEPQQTFEPRYCKNGHWMTKATVEIAPRTGGYAKCRVCAKASRDRYKARKRAEAA